MVNSNIEIDPLRKVPSPPRERVKARGKELETGFSAPFVFPRTTLLSEAVPREGSFSEKH